MDENQTQQLQEELTQALIEGNADKQREVEGRINTLLGTQEAVPEVVGEQPKVEEVAKEEGTEGKEAPPPSEKTEVEAKPPTESEQNWLDSLAPEVRKNAEELLENYKRLEHRLKSEDGRVAAYQRRYHELQQQAARQQEELQALKSAKPQEQPAAQKQTPAVDDDLKAIMEVDEQLGRTIMREREERERLRAELDRRLSEIDSKVTPVQSAYEDMEVQREMTRLTSYVPNAVEILRSPYYKEFVDTSPPAIRQLAESSRADEVYAAIRLYGDWASEYNAGQPQQTQPNPEFDDKARKVQQERERKLQSQPVGSAAIKPPAKTEPTIEEIYNDPKLLEQYQNRIMQDELKKIGYL